VIFDIRNATDVRVLRRAFDGLVVGLTSGCYDLYHSMHQVYLVRCARMCDVLIVGLDSDDLVRAWKGPTRPIVPEHQRLAVLSGLSCVTACFTMGSLDDFQRAVDELNVRKIFKNQAIKPEECIGRDKAEVITVPDIGNHSSTTGIIEEIKRQVVARTTDDRQPVSVAPPTTVQAISAVGE
jgi:D-beta-D-heptose 7-phosphate kinase/D-beta-D-heptose 1-phosphate adenosyltransferase